jgi:hypothetical protein
MRSALTMILVVMLVGGLVAATQPETLVGCLQPGRENGSFVLAKDGTGNRPGDEHEGRAHPTSRTSGLADRPAGNVPWRIDLQSDQADDCRDVVSVIEVRM